MLKKYTYIKSMYFFNNFQFVRHFTFLIIIIIFIYIGIRLLKIQWSKFEEEVKVSVVAEINIILNNEY